MARNYLPYWNEERKNNLRSLYSRATWDELLDAFPGATRHAIYREARKLKLSRGLAGRSRSQYRNDPLMQQLRRRRIFLGMTQEELAVKTGYGVERIETCERSQKFPSYPFLKDWCQALGLELETRIVLVNHLRAA